MISKLYALKCEFKKTKAPLCYLHTATLQALVNWSEWVLVWIPGSSPGPLHNQSISNDAKWYGYKIIGTRGSTAVGSLCALQSALLSSTMDFERWFWSDFFWSSHIILLQHMYIFLLLFLNRQIPMVYYNFVIPSNLIIPNCLGLTSNLSISYLLSLFNRRDVNSMVGSKQGSLAKLRYVRTFSYMNLLNSEQSD